MKKVNYVFAFLIALCTVFSSKAQNTHTPYVFIKKIHLDGDAKWDYLKMDGEAERLYISHGDRVHVIDIIKDSAIAELKGFKGVHGLTLNKELHKLYVTNVEANTLEVFDTKTFKKLSTIALKGGKVADAILYDKFSDKVLVCFEESQNIIVIDSKTDKLTGIITLGGNPEFICAGEKGIVYNNINDKNEVAVIDANTQTIIKRFPLGTNSGAKSITIDTKNQRLFVTCRATKTLVVLNSSSGEIVATAPIGEKVDGVIYDKDLQILITSNGDGTATVIKQETPDKYSVIQTVQTHKGCKTIVHRGSTHRFYTPASDYQGDGKTVVPGTFGVNVYGFK